MQLETVGEMIRTLRARRGLEQVELARACGWRDASAVSRIETDRIHPTRRTLVKLADNLGNGEAGVPRREQVRSWLFLAAGIPPAADEVDALGPDLPAIEQWAHPAAIMDFTWTLWLTNEAFRTLLGVPERHAGRHYLAMMFEPDGAVRRHLHDRWDRVARATLQHFRADTERRVSQRWFKKLMVRLDGLPDFAPMWAHASVPPPGVVQNRADFETERGRVALLHLRLRAEPRLILMEVVGERPRDARALAEAGTARE